MEKRALVIGGTRRIGRWAAEALLVDGAQVTSVYHSREEEAKKFVAELKAAGFAMGLLKADITDAELARDAVQVAAEAMGGLELLIYCPGAAARGSIIGTPEADLERIWRSNVLGFHNAVVAATPYLRLGGGRIISFLSAGADSARAFREVPVYGAAKAMLASYCRSLARELAVDNITVNCISLGITTLPAEGAPEVAAERLPMEEPVKQDDVAAAIWYLCGPAAGQTTGTVINLGGAFGL
jgi:NAD(P)-dependent dehydrogenase (short-subunit alcohol dehydrogenase family)